MNSSVRPPAVAAMFYPGDADTLKDMVNQQVAAGQGFHSAATKALIAPHAGYVYSGGVAGSAYQSIKDQAEQIQRVVLLGPAHRLAFRGVAAPSHAYFATPIGHVEVDHEVLQPLIDKYKFLGVLDQAHQQEHGLEVHLPFLQMVLNDFKVVPLVVGQASPDDVAAVLDELWGGEETLVVISSDLSHYHDYATAKKMDAVTAACIESYNYEDLAHDGACGFYPVRGLMKVASERNLSIHRLDMCNSGDTAGDKNRVVGYGAWALVED